MVYCVFAILLSFGPTTDCKFDYFENDEVFFSENNQE